MFEFKKLSVEDIISLLRRAITNVEYGYGRMRVSVEEDALLHLTNASKGRCHGHLGALELGVLTADKNESGTIHIDLETAQECIQVRAIQYDKKGDNHYDTISAFIKSLQGSDPDAALFGWQKCWEPGKIKVYCPASGDFCIRRMWEMPIPWLFLWRRQQPGPWK